MLIKSVPFSNDLAKMFSDCREISENLEKPHRQDYHPSHLVAWLQPLSKVGLLNAPGPSKSFASSSGFQSKQFSKSWFHNFVQCASLFSL